MRAAVGFSVCLLMLGCASPKPAAPSASPAVAAQETDAQRAQRLIKYSVDSGEAINTADGKKIICKQESTTNTRLKNKKVCLTPAEWQARTDNARDSFKEAVGKGEALPPKGN